MLREHVEIINALLDMQKSNQKFDISVSWDCVGKDTFNIIVKDIVDSKRINRKVNWFSRFDKPRIVVSTVVEDMIKQLKEASKND